MEQIAMCNFFATTPVYTIFCCVFPSNRLLQPRVSCIMCCMMIVRFPVCNLHSTFHLAMHAGDPKQYSSDGFSKQQSHPMHSNEHRSNERRRSSATKTGSDARTSQRSRSAMSPHDSGVSGLQSQYSQSIDEAEALEIAGMFPQVSVALFRVSVFCSSCANGPD